MFSVSSATQENRCSVRLITSKRYRHTQNYVLFVRLALARMTRTLGHTRSLRHEFQELRCFIEVSVLVCVEPAVCMSSDLLTKPELKSPVVQDAFADEGPDRLAQLLELYLQLLGGTHCSPDKMHYLRMHAPPTT